MNNADSRIDLSSQSNPSNATATNIAIEWALDFEKKTLSGSVTHTVVIVKSGTSVLSFDSKDLQLQPQAFIISEKGGASGVPVAITVGGSNVLGQKVTVPIPDNLRSGGSEFRVKFLYATSPEASAVQWLSPENTAGKQKPYVFTQCQAIHARSLLPCMDSPGAKVTYSAVVTCPDWCTVLMSAIQEGDKEISADGIATFRYRQPVPISTYLIALAGGRMTSKDVSPRVRIWAEPEVTDVAAYEFSETEEFLKTAESLTCPYQWGRYDVLCLPPSFPYGGMENPCLTFATPTLLAGDKSLANVIAHEIAHSWTGNLVTNHTWEHFWLNEGWTVWLERKIMSRYKGDPNILKLSAQIGWKHLEDDIALFGSDNGFTNLVWPLSGEDPDEAFSRVPYEKGFNLLMRLERIVGTENFEAFAKSYIAKFKFQTVTSQDFKDHFMSTFATGETAANVACIDWDEVFYAPGLPQTPDFSNPLSIECLKYADSWLAIEKGEDDKESTLSGMTISHWSTEQMNIFLEKLLKYAVETAPISEMTLRKIDDAYHFTDSGNSEIRFRWQSICLKSEALWILPKVVDFVGSQGRMKFVRPLYRALKSLKQGDGLAKETFEKLKSLYHPIARKMVAQDLGVSY